VVLLEAEAAGGDHLAVQRLSEVGVRESVADVTTLRVLFEQRDADRLLDRGEELLFGHVRYRAEYVEREVSPHHGGDAEDPVTFFTEARQALANDVPQAFR